MQPDAAEPPSAPIRFAAGMVAAIDGLCRWSGAIVAWMTLATVLLCFATVYLRYALGFGLIWLQESYVWTHVAVIVLGAGYTMMSGGFVRVDVFYAGWSNRRRAAVDAAMTVLVLAPFLWVLGSATWRFWLTSYVSDEASLNPGGMPNLWLLKATLLGFLVLVGLQGLAFVLRGLLVLAGREEFALQHAGHAPEQNV